MCLAAAYPSTGSNEPVLENITHMKLHGDRVQMETLFGQKKAVSGRVLEVDFIASKVIVNLDHTSAVRSKPGKSQG